MAIGLTTGQHQTRVHSPTQPNACQTVGDNQLVSTMTISSEPSLVETEAVARELFTQFTREQLTHEGISPSEFDQQIQELSSNGYNISSPLMVSVGRDLRRISEAFARSTERAEVRERAFRINFRDLTREEFNSLLSELFLNGNISRERIVVLFFFCSDLAVNAFTNGSIAYFKRLIQWSLSYIFNHICLWVQRQGGWEIVLGSYVPRLAITVFALMGCLAFGIYIKRSLF
ncbi:unnamed protein product [Oppiella nova]|uniref:Bcl-2 Bcl-2 homology region 1-3 domain-containing protein n=1 Tax=Oppiella nova TaxID=334625 RepID=A0A7R9M3I4_9ACAR|nr:unnamed protein product [Oppiella nova]CAG2169894.1 unnamed protein product [Oppiella nova]